MISVITICYNDILGLKATLSSVLSQKGVDFEYVVIDGASTDGSLELLKSIEIDNPNCLGFRFVSEPDGGIYDAINKGLNTASGTHVIFMNAADRFYEDDSLAALWASRSNVNGIDYSLGRPVYEYPNGIYRYDYSPSSPSSPEICHQALLYSKACHDRLGFYNLKYRSAADYDFFCRLQNEMGQGFTKSDKYVAIRRKTSRDSSESLANGLEMLRIDWLRRAGSVAIIRRASLLMKKVIKISLVKLGVMS